MYKGPFYRFQEAVTTRAARDFDLGLHEENEIPQDVLWRRLEENRWPIDEMVNTQEGRLYIESLGRIVEEKLVKLRTVDQQR